MNQPPPPSPLVVVSPSTNIVYVDEKPPQHVSLLSRDIAGNFVHHLTEKQISHLAKRLEPKKGKHYGEHHKYHHNKKDEIISVDHLRNLLNEVHVPASHAELRALAAVLSATDGDHFTMSDNTASRLRELVNEPHLHVWSSEEWHVALKEERRKASRATRAAENKMKLHKETIKLHRLANIKKKIKAGRDRSYDVHEKAKKHLAKVAKRRRRVFEKKWKHVEDKKNARKLHKKRQEKEGHAHINFERILFRLRQGSMNPQFFQDECERCERCERTENIYTNKKSENDEELRGIIKRNDFYSILKKCSGMKFTSEEYQQMSKILDPDNTENISYEDFLWAFMRQRGNNGFILQLPQFIPARGGVITNNNNDSNSSDSGRRIIYDSEDQKYNNFSDGRRAASNLLDPGILVFGIVQAIGFQTENTAVQIAFGKTDLTTSTLRSTEVRWNSNAPTFNELWTCNAQKNVPVSLTLLGCNQEGVPTKSMGLCSIPIHSPTVIDGITVEDRWYSLSHSRNSPNDSNSSSSTSHVLGEMSSNSKIPSVMNPEIRIITCIVPKIIPSTLVVERPGHHALGRVHWCARSQGQLQSGMAFLFRGVLVLTKKNSAADDEEGGLAVVQAISLWGCTTNSGEIIERETTINNNNLNINIRRSNSSEDDEYQDDFEIDDDGAEVTLVDNKSIRLFGVSITLATRTIASSDDSGRVLLSSLNLFPMDYSVKKLLSVIEAASQHYHPHGGWCIPRDNNSIITGENLVESQSFQCMLVEQNMTKWPGTLRINQDVITFSADSPLGYMSVEINVGKIKNVALTGQNVMPPTNAITITYIIENEKGEDDELQHTFTTLPSAGLALQCIMKNIREYSSLHFDEKELSRRYANNAIFPGEDLVLKSVHLRGSRSKTNLEITPKGFSKIDNFYHDTLLTEAHHFGPKGRHSPVVRRVLGLVVVDNLETAKPTPPSSVRSNKRRQITMRGRQLSVENEKKNKKERQEKRHAQVSRSEREEDKRIHWTKEIEVLSLLNFTSGSGRPFTQLVTHTPSKTTFALHVIPSQTQNMFQLARLAVVALRVDHPNICRCYGTTQVGESIQFLWEHSRMTLKDHINASFLGMENISSSPPESSRKWIRQLISGISHLHSVGIVHRNLIASNIMIMDSANEVGNVRLNGFGISKYLVKGRTTTICGEPTNMSPERVLGHPHGFGSDWWSLGLLIHEIFSGQPLFTLESKKKKSMSIYERIVECRYAVSDLIDPSWTNIIRRLVAHETYRLGCTGYDRNGSCGAEVLMHLVTRQWWEDLVD